MRRKKNVDTELIMSLEPCKGWPESRVREAVPKLISLLDFLRSEHIPAEDRLWVALHGEFVSAKIARLFACDCAERILQRERDSGIEPDPRSWDAVAVARRYAMGEATDGELAAARYAAWDAAWSAAWYAAWSAARYAAWVAAWAAAMDAAWGAAWDATNRWSIDHLIEMIKKEEKKNES